jgi:membrane protein implicated in regulation of membrane protease activity
LSNPLRKIIAFVATVALISLALMFSLVVFAVILVIGAMAWAYLWWKTRELRKQMRNYPPRGMVMEGEVVEGEVIRGQVIEGEVIRVEDSRDERGH